MKIALILLTLAASAAFAQQPCEQLKNLALPNTRIVAAIPVPAGSFTIPGQTAPTQVVAFCRVEGVVWPEVNFEVWLPANWNRKFLGLGNGGLAGTITYSGMPGSIASGYAVASTDTGHKASDPTWALGHMERVVDFGHRGIHVMTQAAKAITAAHYGRAPEHSYFDGCSNGGRQALMEAQRYPEDYEGIIAGDPAHNWTHLYTGGHMWALKALEGDAYIPQAKVAVLAEAVNKACDELDGIKDGILNDPRRCHFDPAILACKGADAPTCFTQAQIGAIHKLWNGPRTEQGDQIYPGLMPGGEEGNNGWYGWITSTGPALAGHASLGLPGMRYIAYEDANWDWKTLKYDAPKGFDSDVDFVDQKLAGTMNATNTDLTRFHARGGKLIQYHGWSDPDISPLNSIHYYEQVSGMASQDPTHALRDTQEWYRLFLVPGMQHCSAGPGPADFRMITALEQWVEKGTAPDKVIATHATAGKVDRSRPLCPYPQEAQYKGSGSTDDAANFVCGLPQQP